MEKNDELIKTKFGQLLTENENKQLKKKKQEIPIVVINEKRIADKNTVKTKLNQNIKQKKILDIISKTDFNFILEHINPSNFNSKRNKLALILLYITGIKLNFLLQLKVSHLNSLLKDKFFTLPLKNNENLLVYIIKEHDKYLIEIQKLSKIIIENKSSSDFIFTKKDNKKTLSRETLTRILNAILQKAGDNLKKKKFLVLILLELLIFKI